jgi:hypothetical protein
MHLENSTKSTRLKVMGLGQPVNRDMLEARALHLDGRDEDEHTDTPNFPADDDAVEPDEELPANCQIGREKNENGKAIPGSICDYVGENYSEWVDGLTKPFESDSGCELSKVYFASCQCSWEYCEPSNRYIS